MRILACALVAGALTLQASAQPVAPIEISGQVRVRSELDALNMNGDETLVAHLLRSRLGVTARPAEHIRLFLQVQDSRGFGTELTSAARGTADASADALDMHQAWGEIDSIGGEPIGLRVGRQELSFANERLLGASNWSNTGRSFDAIRGSLVSGDLRIDAVASRLAVPSDFAAEGENLYAVWSTLRVAPELTADLYVLRDDNMSPAVTDDSTTGEIESQPQLERATIGTWLRGVAGVLDYDVEGIGQLGTQSIGTTTARRDIRAFLLSGQLGVMIDAPTKSRAFLLGTVLSGDGSPGDSVNEAFNTLFGTNHKFYGISDVLPVLSGSAGLIDLALGFQTTPSAPLRLGIEGHYFLPQRGSSESFGSEVNLQGWWRPTRPMEISGGVALYMVGPGLERRLGEGTRTWAFIAGQWDF